MQLTLVLVLLSLTGIFAVALEVSAPSALDRSVDNRTLHSNKSTNHNRSIADGPGGLKPREILDWAGHTWDVKLADGIDVPSFQMQFFYDKFEKSKRHNVLLCWGWRAMDERGPRRYQAAGPFVDDGGGGFLKALTDSGLIIRNFTVDPESEPKGKPRRLWINFVWENKDVKNHWVTHGRWDRKIFYPLADYARDFGGLSYWDCPLHKTPYTWSNVEEMIHWDDPE